MRGKGLAVIIIIIIVLGGLLTAGAAEAQESAKVARIGYMLPSLDGAPVCEMPSAKEADVAGRSLGYGSNSLRREVRRTSTAPSRT